MSFLRRFLAGAICALVLASSVSAQELTGAWITEVPKGDALHLGSRVIRAGDVLTTAQLEKLTLQGQTESVIRYLPILDSGLQPEAELVIALGTRKNEAPTAEDSLLETYRNLPNEGLLKVSDPEGDVLTFTLTRQPRRGDVVIREDGSFLYTPKKNKVGTDSFTFTAADAAGNVSREATVTVRILKPTDEQQYADTAASDCRFEAEWLRSTGVFTGETVNGQFCFSPDEPVSRGQFLAMLMQVLDMPVDRNVQETGFLDESPQWLKPYLAAALRSGIIAGFPAGDGAEFRPEQTVSAAEAARMAGNALRFAVPAAALDDAEPIRADDTPMTRSGAAKLLYRLNLLRRGNGLLGLFQ
jgi:hypothetical protein